MHFGGAAKKTTMIANELVHRGNVVSIVTDTRLPIAFSLSSNINIIPLYDSNRSRNHISRFGGKLRRIRNIVRTYRPDVVISVLPHVSFYVKLSLIGINIPIVFSDETSFARKDNCFIHFIRHRFYNVADAVIVLTNNDVRLLGNNIRRKVVIHNPIICPKSDNTSWVKNKTILAIGPLEEWNIKGFDLLIQAFGKIAKEFPDWKLEIAGYDKEPYRSQILELASKEGILNQIYLLGFRKDIYKIMGYSAIYALSSRIEGFSLSLVEAISQGCACVAFGNHGVIDEVSCGGKGVLIVKDGAVNDFAESLKKLMLDQTLREKLAQEGEECVKQYNIELIADRWEITLNKLIKRNNRNENNRFIPFNR